MGIIQMPLVMLLSKINDHVKKLFSIVQFSGKSS